MFTVTVFEIKQGAAENMKLDIIPKQDIVPTFDPNTIQIKHITCYHDQREWAEGEITQDLIDDLLKQIPLGGEVYLSLDLYGEDNWLQVVCDRKWLALGYSSEHGQRNFYSYNPDYTGVEEWSPLIAGGQSQIEKYLALTDIQAGIQAVEYFIYSGELYPGIDWAKQI